MGLGAFDVWAKNRSSHFTPKSHYSMITGIALYALSIIGLVVIAIQHDEWIEMKRFQRQQQQEEAFNQE